jgi:lysophospholipase L1-like esterase
VNLRGGVALIGVLLLVVACSGNEEGAAYRPSAAPAPEGPEYLYVAIGASETVGAGGEEPLREAWPQVLFRTALPPGAAFVNLAIPGTTVAGALQRELPYAIELRPDLVTIWLNVNDLVAGVTAERYERALSRLVSKLRAGGVKEVLIANTPPLIHLPAYRSCRPNPPPGGPPCFADEALPAPREVSELVDRYNESIERVAAREGATVVDLHERARALLRAGAMRRLVSADGLHPSAAGHRDVAAAFAEALRSPPGAGG